jgi:hypothetical protein
MTAALLDDLWVARQSFIDEKEFLKTKIWNVEFHHIEV